MKFCRLIPLACLILAASPTDASPAEVERIQKIFQLSMEKWALEVGVATTPEARAAAWQKRPDPAQAAAEMWKVIGPALPQDWTIEPAAWFLQVAAGQQTTLASGAIVPAFEKELQTVREAVETHHLSSPKLLPICMGLAATGDPRSLALLEKIDASHPDRKTQGVAALGAAMILKSLGDAPELMRKRLTHLRKAIIESADVEVGGTAVAKLAEDELYIIKNLTKGRVAPDLAGTDSAGRPVKLSDHQGKIIVLLFWNSNMPEADHVVEMTSAMKAKFSGRPVAIIGVNNDPSDTLRALQADGSVDWINISDASNKLAPQYRVGTWPLVYVLDHERKIHYTGPPGSFVDLTAEALIGEIRVTPTE